MTGATIRTAQAAIDRAGLPLEIVRGEGYHYFIHDDRAAGNYASASVMVPYTSHQTAERWAEDAAEAWAQMRKDLGLESE